MSRRSARRAGRPAARARARSRTGRVRTHRSSSCFRWAGGSCGLRRPLRNRAAPLRRDARVPITSPVGAPSSGSRNAGPAGSLPRARGRGRSGEPRRAKLPSLEVVVEAGLGEPSARAMSPPTWRRTALVEDLRRGPEISSRRDCRVRKCAQRAWAWRRYTVRGHALKSEYAPSDRPVVRSMCVSHCRGRRARAIYEARIGIRNLKRRKRTAELRNPAGID